MIHFSFKPSSRQALSLAYFSPLTFAEKIKYLSICVLVPLFTSCSTPVDLGGQPPTGSSPAIADHKSTANEVANTDLRRLGIDPTRLKRSFRYKIKGNTYFENRPNTDYWNIGRAKVNNETVDILTVSEPKLGLGGVSQYLFRSGTSDLLWVYRGV